MSERIRNAVIESADIYTARGVEIWVNLEYGDGTGQGFGGYQLDPDHARVNYAGVFIRRLLQVAGVSQWSELPGKAVRVRRDEGRAAALGHILREDWFDPRAELYQEVR